MEKTIRDTIKEISEELRNNIDLLEPTVAARKQIELSSLFSSLNRYIAEKDFEYKTILRAIRLTSKSSVEAKIQSEATPEYKELSIAKLEKESLLELIRS